MRATAVALTLALVAPVSAADDEVVKVKPEQIYIDLTLTRRLPPAQRPAAEKQVYDTAEKVWKKKFEGKVCEVNGKVFHRGTGEARDKEMTVSLPVSSTKTSQVYVSFRDPQKGISLNKVYTIRGTAEIERDGNIPHLILKDAEIVTK